MATRLADRVKRLEERRDQVVQEIENLVAEFRRKRPGFHDGSLYLGVKKHRPDCSSCPHGPYWYQATFTRHRKWIGRYVGRRLNKKIIYRHWNYRDVDLLMVFDQRARQVRARKLTLLGTIASIRRLLDKALTP
jgi:hypothetical protein